MAAYITVGAKTSHGGMVISGSPHTTHNGISVARKGDKVICKKCKKVTTIVSGDPSFIVDGAPIARGGDVTSCGAKLIAIQQSFAESDFDVMGVEQAEPLVFANSEPDSELSNNFVQDNGAFGIGGKKDWIKGAFSLGLWSQEQGKSPLETRRLLDEYNTGKHYTNKAHPLLSTDKPKNYVGNEEMFNHYLHGQGQPLTLENLGSLELLKKAVVRKGAFKQDGSIQSRFIHQLVRKFKINDKDYTFENSYNVGKEIGIWAYGSGVIAGKFEGVINKNSVSDIRISGKINYFFKDKFKDPYDTFDWIPGSWDPNGTPYKITGSWSNYINITIKK
ncbi:PAAR domain-containing protein [Psychrobacter sp. Rd 27.2]|uniref:PAAR domain-containing protein n=1 Tax=Psychrobacter sp. Rd 27.2 TaxID=1926479 RepID=UPI00094699C3|nr:PAAR domain-containing protein [Psychrobacter sp. Rd 27.2]OLF40244.1 hypothetical protein BTV99_10080 [Psychrobacter sp. Rd 27.2]